MSWSLDDIYLAVLFHSRDLTMFSRAGEALITVTDPRRTAEPKVFSPVLFSTDPSKLKVGHHSSICWGQGLSISDGFTILQYKVAHYPSLKELSALYLSADESHDLSIDISHETNPLPSELDIGPKSRRIDRAILFLRTVLSSNSETGLFELIAKWINQVFPPALHEEITIKPQLLSLEFQVDARINASLTLRKKLTSIEVYEYLMHLFEMNDWLIVENPGYSEWVIETACGVFKYTLADQQALYAWTVLKLLENWLGFKCRKMRVMLGLACLQEYRNPQATLTNVVYFAVAFLVLRENNSELEFLREFCKDYMEIETSSELGVTKYSGYKGTVRGLVFSGVNYLLGKRQRFNETLPTLCAKLLKGDFDSIESHATLDTLIFFAFYLDPSEKWFISPLEANFECLKHVGSIQGILRRIQRKSTVPVAPENKSEHESGILYLLLGLFDKVVEVFPANIAFLALNRALEDCEETELASLIDRINSVFLRGNYSVMVNLADAELRPVYQTIGLKLLRDQITQIVDRKTAIPMETLVEGFEVPVSFEILGILEEFRGLVEFPTIHQGDTDNWLKVAVGSLPELSHITQYYETFIREIIMLLWYLKLYCNYSHTQSVEWGLRLLPFFERVNEPRIIRTILPSLQLCWRAYAPLAKIYLQFNSETKNLLEEWIKTLPADISKHVNEYLFQSSSNSPWTRDDLFYSFCKDLTTKSMSLHKKTSNMKSKWEKQLKQCRQKYRIQGRILLKNGLFTYSKPTRKQDIGRVTAHFHLNLELKESNLTSNFYLSHASPIAPLRERTALTLHQRSPTNLSNTYKQLSCKILSHFIYSKVNPLFKALSVQKETSSRQANFSFVPSLLMFFKAKSNIKIVVSNAVPKVPLFISQFSSFPMKHQKGTKSLENPDRINTSNAFQIMRIRNN